MAARSDSKFSPSKRSHKKRGQRREESGWNRRRLGFFEPLEERRLLALTAGVNNVDISNLPGPQSAVSIAVNPTNTSNVVAVSQESAANFVIHTYFSTNGGATWTTVNISTADGNSAGDARVEPIAAFDSDGNVYVAYIDFTSSGPIQSRVMLAKSVNGGASYSQFTSVATDSLNGNLATPNLVTRAAAGADSVAVTWARGSASSVRIQAALSTDGGATFPVTNNTINDAAQRTFFPTIAVDTAGAFHVAWEVNTGGGAGVIQSDTLNAATLASGADVTVTTVNITDSFAATSKIPAQPDRGINSIATLNIDRSGGTFNNRMYITYTNRANTGTNDTNIFSRFSIDGGATWSAPLQVNDDGGTTSQFLPRSTIDPTTGHLFVFWYDARFDSTNNQLTNLFGSESIDGGASWQFNTQVANFQSNESTTNTSRDAFYNYNDYIGATAYGGVVYTAWTDARDSNFTGGVAEEVYTTTFVDASLPVNIFNGVMTLEGDDDFINEDDTFKIQLDPTGQIIQVFINNNTATPTFSVPKALIVQINVFGAGGNDNLIVDSSNGLLNLLNGIRYDGDYSVFGGEGGSVGFGGFDKLTLQQTGGPTQTSDTYTMGPNLGDGISVIAGLGGVQTIYFQNLEPVFDNVPAATATVNATPANNAINYTQGPGGGIFVGNTGRVTVDEQETYEFNNKTNLVINALAGDDKINLNNPTIPAGLTGTITVNGGDPTASDVLVINGIPGTDRFFVQNLTGVGAGQVRDESSIGADIAPQVFFTGIESMNIVGQNSDSDSINYTGTTGDDTFTITPGATASSGVISGYTGAFDFVPVSYSGITGYIAPSSSILIPATGLSNGATIGVGGNDTVILNGTSADDTFLWDATNQMPFVRVGTGGIVHTPISLWKDLPGFGNVASVIYRGFEGNDQFNVAPSRTPGQNLFSIIIDGGDSDPDPDTLNYQGDTGSTMTVSLSTAGNVQSVVATNTPGVLFDGVEIVNVSAVTGTLAALVVNGTAQNDHLSYTSISDTAGSFKNSLNPTVFNFSALGFASPFTFNGLAGNANELLILGTSGRDRFILRADNRTAQAVDASNFFFHNVTLANDVQILTALGYDGVDTFQVTPAAGIQFGTTTPANIDNLVINVDGGGAENALLVWNNGQVFGPLTMMVINRRSTTQGTVRVYNNLFDQVQITVQWPDINYVNVGTVVPYVTNNPAGAPQTLLYMGQDPYEPNNNPPVPPAGGSLTPNNLATATFLGSGPTINVPYASIFPNFTEFAGLQQIDVQNPIQAPDYDVYSVEAQTTGTLDITVNYTSYFLLPGVGTLNVLAYDSRGNQIGDAAQFQLGVMNGAGGARIRLPAIQGQTYYFMVYGTFQGSDTSNPAVINGYSMTIINQAPPKAYDGELSRSTSTSPGSPDTGDLPFNAPNSDTGRSQFDNVTQTSFPFVYFRLSDGFFLNDIPGNDIPAAFPTVGNVFLPYSDGTIAGYRVAIFDGDNAQTPNGGNLLGFATPVAGFPGLYQFQPPFGLADGLHHLVARVQMVLPTVGTTQTGFGDVSDSLDIIVDTQDPEVFFGSPDPAAGVDGLSPESDSGSLAPGSEGTLLDRITNDQVPYFWGTAEANSIIRVFATVNNPASPLFGQLLLVGVTVTLPFDGTNAYYDGLGNPLGQWKVRSNVNLNDPTYFTRDGLRRISVTAEDLAGNVFFGGEGGPPSINIFLDTQGPQVSDVRLTGSPAFNLFLDKTDGTLNTMSPTPISNSLTFKIVDSGNRDPNDFPFDPALIQSIAQSPGAIQLKGDANGIIPIQSVVVTLDPIVDGQPATATIVVTFKTLKDQNGLQAEWGLLDDRYTLTISQELTDIAGNNLNGEGNGQEPTGNPTFPSGNGVPGGDFVARFTIDSKPEVAVYSDGTVNMDLNGNGHFDPTNVDYTNRDKSFAFGYATDTLFAGVLHKPGQAPNNLFDKIGAYGNVNGTFRWLLDTDGNGTPDTTVVQASTVKFGGVNYSMNAFPFVVKYNGNYSLGLFDGKGNFFIDTNKNDRIDSADFFLHTTARGLPIAGDFDGNGEGDLGTYNANDGRFYMFMADDEGVLPTQNNALFRATGIDRSGLTVGVNVSPIAGDLNGDGITDIGLAVVGRTTQSDTNMAEWYFFTSNVSQAHTRVLTQDHPFAPYPLGRDIFYQFASNFQKPLFGNFDPPPAVDDGGNPTPALFTGAAQYFDQQGSTLYVSGDSPNDVFTLTATDATHFTVTMNGQSQSYDTATINQVVFNDAAAGASASITDSFNALNASLASANSVVTRDGLEIDLLGPKTVRVYGNAGSSAVLKSVAGATTVGTSSYTQVNGSGVFLQAVSFGHNSVTAANKTDRAVLYVATKQTFVNTASYSSLNGTGLTTVVNGFHNVSAVSKSSTAVAHFYLSGKDTFVGAKASSYVDGAYGHDVATGFTSVIAHAGGKGDKATLNAAKGGSLVAREASSYIVSGAYRVTATGFANVAATATKGSGSKASLFDSRGNDTLTAANNTATLVTAKYRVSATNFDVVDAVHSAGTDSATVSAIDFILKTSGWQLS